MIQRTIINNKKRYVVNCPSSEDVGNACSPGTLWRQSTDLQWYSLNLTGTSGSNNLALYVNQTPLTWVSPGGQDFGYQLLACVNNTASYQVYLHGNAGNVTCSISQTPWAYDQSNCKPYLLLQSLTDTYFYPVYAKSGSIYLYPDPNGMVWPYNSPPPPVAPTPPAPVGPPDNHLILDVDGIAPYDVDVTDPTGVLDYSNNSYVYCYAKNCPDLTELNVGGNNLVILDISSSTALTTLYCNYNQLTSLNLSGSTALTYLYCNYNQLASLNIMGCTGLPASEFLYYNNPIQSLNISATLFGRFTITGSSTLTTLTANSCSILTQLYCYNNPNLVSVDASRCKFSSTTTTALSMSKCPSLTTFSASNCNPKLTAFPGTILRLNNVTSSLKYIDLSVNNISAVNANAILVALHSGSLLSGSINLSGGTNANPTLGGLTAINSLKAKAWNISTRLTPSFTVNTAAAIAPFTASFTNTTPAYVGSGVLTYLFNFGDGSPTTASANVSHIYTSIGTFTASLQITSSDGAQSSYNTSIVGLLPSVDGHLVADSDWALPYDYDVTNPTTPTINNTAYVWAAAVNCHNLTYLDCDNNQLTSLNLLGSTALTYLDCGNNKLTSLDVSTNTAVTYLDCNSNQLTSLDVSTNTALTTLYCNYNQLTSLNLSGSTALTNLQCYNNQLTSLDISTNTALTYFACDTNQLTSLDVSTNTALIILGCDDNKLTQVAVDKILLDLVTNGQTDGEVNLSGGTNAPPSSTAPGSNYDILVTTRNWVVTTK